MIRSTDVPVRWGVLGAAAIALAKVIPAMRACRRSRVIAIASRDSAKAEAAADALGIEREHGSCEALLEDAIANMQVIDALFHSAQGGACVPVSQP